MDEPIKLNQGEETMHQKEHDIEGEENSAGFSWRYLLCAGLAVVTLVLHTLIAPVVADLYREITVASMLLLIFLLGYIIKMGARAPLPDLVPEDAGPYQTLPSDEARIEIYARWFIRMRWISIVTAAVMVFITMRILNLLSPGVWWPLICAIGVMVGFNSLFEILVHRRWRHRYHLLFQMYTDLVMLVVFLHFTGGIESPLYLLAYLHVIIAGILLTPRQCYGVAAVVALLFTLLVGVEWSGVVKHYDLHLFPHDDTGAQPYQHFSYVASVLGMWYVTLFLTAYLVTPLVEDARHKERRLVAMADYALAERRLLEQALETTDTGLRVLDRDLRPQWVNRRWKQWFTDDAFVLPTLPESSGQDGTPAGQTLQDRKVRVKELALTHTDHHTPVPFAPDSNQRVFQVTTAPLVDGDGNVSQVVEMVQDVTQQKRTQAQLMQAGKMAAIGELAGNVAHEVNNPISIISAKGRLLLSNQADVISEKVGKDLHKIVDLADRVARIAQGLLNYARPSGGTRIPIDIRVPIRRALDIIAHQMQKNNITVEDRFSEHPFIVQADTNEMEQILLNLFLNAMDAMPQGGRLTVTTSPGSVALADDRPGIDVVVEDTGTGLPDTIRERIFEPFFTTKEEGKGTGLGLSICLGLVHSHEGKIEVDSVPGQGTRFTVTLPIDADRCHREE